MDHLAVKAGIPRRHPVFRHPVGKFRKTCFPENHGACLAELFYGCAVFFRDQIPQHIGACRIRQSPDFDVVLHQNRDAVKRQIVKCAVGCAVQRLGLFPPEGGEDTDGVPLSAVLIVCQNSADAFFTQFHTA